MEEVRIGVVGIGNIGTYHVQYLSAGETKGARITAVCDINPQRLEAAKAINPKLATFDNIDKILNSGLLDGVIIATPHYFHPPYAIKAFEKGINVMSEKPAGVYTKQVREMNEAAKKSGLVFSIMFNQRTTPVYKKLEEILKAGELGEMKRVNYTMSEFYRCQAYYNSGGWRGTWSGEGGGLLLNQCPHNLDIWQRMCGVPVRVRAFCGFGKYRDIEVEDEVTAYVEYKNGATGLLISSVSESPGTNRMELVGDMGKIVVEDEKKITFWRNRPSEKVYNATSKASFGRPEVWTCDVPVTEVQANYHEGHKAITQNWVNAILHGEPLIAPGEEGMKVTQISNAIHLSAWTDDWATIPVDEEKFYALLQEQIKKSTFQKKNVSEQIERDIFKTF